MSDLVLRLVRFRIREGTDAALFELYRDRVVPSLAVAPGCLLAALLRPWTGDQHASLTLWADPASATAYEDSGVYHRLLRDAASLFVPETQWRVREPVDPRQTLDLERREIPAEAYAVAAGDAAAALGAAEAGLFVRFAAVRVRPDRGAEFLRLYESEILPALAARPGWRGGFLARADRNASEVLSVTTWEQETDALRYEMSGEFERLSYRVQDTFSSLTRSGEHQALQVPQVESFELVAGRRLERRPPDRP